MSIHGGKNIGLSTHFPSESWVSVIVINSQDLELCFLIN